MPATPRSPSAISPSRRQLLTVAGSAIAGALVLGAVLVALSGPASSTASNAAGAVPTTSAALAASAPNAASNVGASTAGMAGFSTEAAMSPAASYGSLRLDVLGFYAPDYSDASVLQTPIRNAASAALACLASTGYRPLGANPFTWVVGLDRAGQFLAAVANDPLGDMRVNQCLAGASQSVRFPPPTRTGAPISFGIRTQITSQ